MIAFAAVAAGVLVSAGAAGIMLVLALSLAGDGRRSALHCWFWCSIFATVAALGIRLVYLM